MSNKEGIYELEEDKSENGLVFFFISKGEQDIIKAIQFSFVQERNGRNIYNLGFGDYDPENDKLEDDVNTNNGDAFRVFNTVLSTIPIFFQHFANEVLMVQGSDGSPEFVEKCKLICKKKCVDECKNYNRRINVYRGYVDKNYLELIAEYQFLGGIKNNEEGIIVEPYERYKKYDSVFLFRKNHNFTL